MGLDEIRKLKAQAGLPKEKKTYYIPKVSEKKKKQIADQKESGTESGLDKWFDERRKEMTGRCANCGGKTSKDNDKFYRFCIAHVLPKRKSMFPSVATNSKNWMELCFFGKSCHKKYDSSWEDAAQMQVWPYAIEQIGFLYPFLTKEEKSRIPDTIGQELNIGL